MGSFPGLRRLLCGLALALAPWAGFAADAGAGQASRLGPTIEPARGRECVADPAFMRRNHMELLKHQRNETVHLGVRDARASLKGCIECHASRDTGSVAAAKTDFCVSCHSFAAVKVDCFECHSAKRQAVGFAPFDHLQPTTLAAARLVAQWRQMTEAAR